MEIAVAECTVAGKTANIPTPIVTATMCFIRPATTTGERAAEIVAKGDELAAEEVWHRSASDLRTIMAASVLIGDYLYGGHGQNQGFPFCVNFMTGENSLAKEARAWERARSGDLRRGKLYFRYENGLMAA